MSRHLLPDDEIIATEGELVAPLTPEGATDVVPVIDSITGKVKLIIAIDDKTEEEVLEIMDWIDNAPELDEYRHLIGYKFNDLLSELGMKGIEELLTKTKNINLREGETVKVAVGEHNLQLTQTNGFITLKLPNGREIVTNLQQEIKNTEDVELPTDNSLEYEEMAEKKNGAFVFLDGKWHDISNTLKNYLKKLAERPDLASRVEYISIHTSNGTSCIQEVVKLKKELGLSNLTILGITALTSLDDNDTYDIYNDSAIYTTLKLAELALNAGIDGLVCSPKEAPILRSVFGYDFKLVTPGVRFEGGDRGDQKRVVTPAEAVKLGSNTIVMGRPILRGTKEETIAAIMQFFEEVKGVIPEIDESKYLFYKALYSGDIIELLRFIGGLYIAPEPEDLPEEENTIYVRLASGFASNAFANNSVMETYGPILDRLSHELRKLLFENKIIGNESQLDPDGKEGFTRIDYIVGAEMGSVRLSGFLGRLMDCKTVYAEKKDKNSKEVEFKRHSQDFNGKNILLSEDVVTEGTTIKNMIDLIEKEGGNVTGITCAINRYGKDIYIHPETGKEYPIYALGKLDAKMYKDGTTKMTPANAKRYNDIPWLPGRVDVNEKPKYNWGKLIEFQTQNLKT